MNGASLVASVRGTLQGPVLIPRRELELLSSIGEGGFSEVWEGRWFGSPVAIKRFKLPNASVDGENDAESSDAISSRFQKVAAAFCREVNLHSSLAFPGIVPVLGVCVPHPLAHTAATTASLSIDGSPRSLGLSTGGIEFPPPPLVDLMLVMEQAPLGSLFGVLHVHNHRTAPVPMSYPLRLTIAADCASALAFMHARKVVHRDVKSMNVLVFPGWRVKLCDLGLATPLEHCLDGAPEEEEPATKHKEVEGGSEESEVEQQQQQQQQQDDNSAAENTSVGGPPLVNGAQAQAPSVGAANDTGRGTFAWLAPEAMTKRRYSFASDVFSLACLLYELTARRLPFEGLSDHDIQRAVAQRGERPDLGSDLGSAALDSPSSSLGSPSSSSFPGSPLSSPSPPLPPHPLLPAVAAAASSTPRQPKSPEETTIRLPSAMRELISRGWHQNSALRPSALEMEALLRSMVDDGYGGDPRTDDLLAALNINLNLDSENNLVSSGLDSPGLDSPVLDGSGSGKSSPTATGPTDLNLDLTLDGLTLHSSPAASSLPSSPRTSPVTSSSSSSPGSVTDRQEGCTEGPPPPLSRGDGAREGEKREEDEEGGVATTNATTTAAAASGSQPGVVVVVGGEGGTNGQTRVKEEKHAQSPNSGEECGGSDGGGREGAGQKRGNGGGNHTNHGAATPSATIPAAAITTAGSSSSNGSRKGSKSGKSSGGFSAAATSSLRWDDGLDLVALRTAFLEMAESGVILDSKHKELSLHLSRSQGKPFLHNSETGESTFLDEESTFLEGNGGGGGEGEGEGGDKKKGPTNNNTLTPEIVQEANAIMHKLIRHYARDRQQQSSASSSRSSSPRGTKKAPPGRGSNAESRDNRANSPRSSSPRASHSSSPRSSPPPHALPPAATVVSTPSRKDTTAQPPPTGGACAPTSLPPSGAEVNGGGSGARHSSSRTHTTHGGGGGGGGSSSGSAGSGGSSGGPKLRPGTKPLRSGRGGCSTSSGGPGAGRRSGGPRAV